MKRFSLLQLLALIAVVALGLAAIRSGSVLAVQLSFILTIALLLTAVLGTLVRARPFGAWAGFALFGVVWIVIWPFCFDSDILLPVHAIAEMIQPKSPTPAGFPSEFNPAQPTAYTSPAVNSRPEFMAHADILRARQTRVERSATVILLLNSLVMGLAGSIVGRVLEDRRAASG